jgi:hypothetical protein
MARKKWSYDMLPVSRDTSRLGRSFTPSPHAVGVDLSAPARMPNSFTGAIRHVRVITYGGRKNGQRKTGWVKLVPHKATKTNTTTHFTRIYPGAKYPDKIIVSTQPKVIPGARAVSLQSGHVSPYAPKRIKGPSLTKRGHRKRGA